MSSSGIVLCFLARGTTVAMEDVGKEDAAGLQMELRRYGRDPRRADARLLAGNYPVRKLGSWSSDVKERWTIRQVEVGRLWSSLGDEERKEEAMPQS